jgi:hypothetical protein
MATPQGGEKTVTSRDSSSSKQDERQRIVNETRSTSTLFGILVAFLLASITATMVMTNHTYNYTGAPHWVLVGGLTPSSATFRLRNAQKVVLTEDDPLSYHNSKVVFEGLVKYTAAARNGLTDGTLGGVTATNLAANKKYYYATYSTEISESILDTGSFTTPPDSNKGFKFATAGCAWTGSAATVFDSIAEEPDLLFFMHLGDMHYEDLDTANMNLRIQAFDKVMASPSQRNLLNSVGLVYMYDDHDWLGNDSGGEYSSPNRLTALKSYRMAIPHYPLATRFMTDMSKADSFLHGNYQAFTIGSVRFIISDLRSESTANQIFSPTQKAWLMNEISQAANYDFVIWVTTKPWIGSVEPGEDNWMGHEQDRQEVSAFISRMLSGTQNLLAIGSDAHMVAFDDGSNTYYGGNSSNGALSFPILQSGPLDRLGSAKGGPFSDSCHTVEYERNHQYSVVEYKPSADAGSACLEITTYSMDYWGEKNVLFTKKLCGAIFSKSSPGVGSCDSVVLTQDTMSVYGLALALMFSVVLLETYLLGNNFLHRFCLFSLVVVMYMLTMVSGLVIPISALGIDQFDTFAIGMIGLFQIIVVSFFLAVRVCKERCLKR